MILYVFTLLTELVLFESFVNILSILSRVVDELSEFQGVFLMCDIEG